MRHGMTGRRSRSRSNSGSGNGGSGNGGGGHHRGNQNRMQVFDSNGPDVRIRGTAHQIFEKYTVLSKDAASSGDRILAESYSQHAEHYQRVINISQKNNTQSSAVQNAVESAVESVEKQPSAQGNGEEKLVPSSDEKTEDLGLPVSITGAPVSKKEGTEKPVMEDV